MSAISANELTALYKAVAGQAPESITTIAGSGSSRQYFRMSGPVRAIGVAGVSAEENRRYLLIGEELRRSGLPVPEVLAAGNGEFDNQYYLLSDAGVTSVFDLISAGRGESKVAEAMRLLGRLHSAPGLVERLSSQIDLKRLAAVVPFDLNYFKYEFLKPCGVEFDEFALEGDFRNLCNMVENLADDVLVYRDFQSRNVVVGPDGDLTLIDFQGALRGTGLYDAVSFLYQAKAGFSSEFRRAMFEEYFRERYGRLPSGNDWEEVRLMALLRTLQVLGAYGFRGLVQRKSHFLGSIRPALRNLDALLNEGVADGLPELKRVAKLLCRDPRFNETQSSGLVVTVQSFSYKSGYPDDLSGNGGGFVFDCRGLHNPGRYDEYKPLTGMDRPVIEFLEARGEVQPFLEAAMAMVDQAVERYLSRGFTSLQVSFGCTGGRHRSVYCAESMAAHLAAIFPDALIILIHREQGIRKEVKA